MISPDFDLKQNARIKAVWPSLWTVDAADELFTAVRDWATEGEYEAAITKYLSKAHFPPTPAAIGELIQEARDVTRSTAPGNAIKELDESWEDSGEMHTIECGKWSMKIPKMHRISGYTARCRMCFDTGWSTFYADSTDRKVVWMFDEWDDISTEQKGRINPHKALCSCNIGRSMPQRDETMTAWYKGQERSISRYPLLEVIESRASIRRVNEVEASKMELVLATEDSLPF